MLSVFLQVIHSLFEIYVQLYMYIRCTLKLINVLYAHTSFEKAHIPRALARPYDAHMSSYERSTSFCTELVMREFLQTRAYDEMFLSDVIKCERPLYGVNTVKQGSVCVRNYLSTSETSSRPLMKDLFVCMSLV